MGLKVGVVGSTGFASAFIRCSRHAPLVRGVVVCDLVPEKQEADAWHGVETAPSLDALLATDVDAVAIITQPWLHGPQALQALREPGRTSTAPSPSPAQWTRWRPSLRAIQERGVYADRGEHWPLTSALRENGFLLEFGRCRRPAHHERAMVGARPRRVPDILLARAALAGAPGPASTSRQSIMSMTSPSQGHTRPRLLPRGGRPAERLRRLRRSRPVYEPLELGPRCTISSATPRGQPDVRRTRQPGTKRVTLSGTRALRAERSSSA